MKRYARHCPPLAALLLAALLPSTGHAQSANGIGYVSVAAARQAMLAKPTVSQRDERQGWLVVTDQPGDDFTTWTFTPKGHPAHPTVVRRDIVFKRGNPTLVTRMHCEARTRACDALYARLRAVVAACTSNCTTVLP